MAVVLVLHRDLLDLAAGVVLIHEVSVVGDIRLGEPISGVIAVIDTVADAGMRKAVGEAADQIALQVVIILVVVRTAAFAVG